MALKVLRPEKVVSQTFVQRFMREAKALGRLDRANIVRIYNVDEDNGTVYIAMEYIEGQTLKEKIKADVYAGLREKILNEREEIKQKTMKMRRMKNLYNHEVEMVCN